MTEPMWSIWRWLSDAWTCGDTAVCVAAVQAREKVTKSISIDPLTQDICRAKTTFHWPKNRKIKTKSNSVERARAAKKTKKKKKQKNHKRNCPHAFWQAISDLAMWRIAWRSTESRRISNRTRWFRATTAIHYPIVRVWFGARMESSVSVIRSRKQSPVQCNYG